MEVKKFWDDTHAQFAVAYTTSFGAGWSSWEPNHPELAYDRRVISYILSRTDEDSGWRSKVSVLNTPEHEAFSARLESWGYKDVYLGGLRHIDIKWLPEGCWWRVNEYDGRESIEIMSDDPYAGWNH